MSSWGGKVFLGFLTLIFLLLLMPHALQKNVSGRAPYKGKIDCCYELLEDLVLYKNFQRRLYVRPLIDPQKSSNSTYRGRISYTTIPDKLKRDPSLIKGSPFEKAVAVIPLGTIIKVNQIFLYEGNEVVNAVHLIGRVDIPKYRNIDIDFRDLFEVYTPECEPKLDVIRPVTCSSINVSDEK